MKKPSIIKSNQKGFTLIELIITIAIAGIIGGAATLAVHQVITIPTISNDHNIAINQVRNAVHWISRDVQGADPDSTSTSPFLSLALVDWESASETWTTHNITYSLEDMTGTELKELWRDYDNGTTQRLIAQYIDQDNSSCTWDDTNNVLTVTITAQVGNSTETRTFEVKPRRDSSA